MSFANRQVILHRIRGVCRNLDALQHPVMSAPVPPEHHLFNVSERPRRATPLSTGKIFLTVGQPIIFVVKHHMLLQPAHCPANTLKPGVETA